jgi:hypothetical protein
MSDRSPDRESQRTISYLLRLWQVRRDEALVWQASLENVRTGERVGFATVEALAAFLWEHTENEAPTDRRRRP